MMANEKDLRQELIDFLNELNREHKKDWYPFVEEKVDDYLKSRNSKADLNTKINYMTTDRIKEIQAETAYPNSRSVQQALLKVWNECQQGQEHVKNCSIPDVVGRSE